MGRWPSGLIDGSRLFAKRQSRLWVERDSRRDGEIQSDLLREADYKPCSRRHVLYSMLQDNLHQPERICKVERRLGECM